MQGKVPVGVTSVAGYTVTLAAVVAAVLAFLKGDRSDQTLGVLAAGGMAVLAFLSTQLGRYAQAHIQIHADGLVQSEKVRRGIVREYEQPQEELGGRVGLGFVGSQAEAGEDAPPEASLYPLTDPTTIPPDVGDAEAEGTA